MPISGLIIDGSSLEQALKTTIARMIPLMTRVLFLFTPQIYPGSNPPTAEFGKMQLRIQEMTPPPPRRLGRTRFGLHVNFPPKPAVNKGFMIFFTALR